MTIKIIILKNKYYICNDDDDDDDDILYLPPSYLYNPHSFFEISHSDSITRSNSSSDKTLNNYCKSIIFLLSITL